MPSYVYCGLLAFLPAITHASILVRSADGTFVPWSLVARAPSGGLPIPLTNNADMAYLTTVMMGTPSQQIQMAPSLSQNQISVASAPQGSSDPTFYNPAKSSSYSQSATPQAASITTIAGGTVTGHYASETCALPGFTYPASVVLTDPSVTTDLYPPGAKAILGYGVNAIPDAPPNATLLGAFLSGGFMMAQCGIELNHKDDPVPNGILTMGAVDPTAFTGDFTSVSVPAVPVDRPSWSIPFDNITYPSNGTSATADGALASIDMYHNGIQVSSTLASTIYSGVPGTKAISDTKWSIPCNATFPITISFGSKPYTMSERDTIVKQDDGSCNGVIQGGAGEVYKVGAPFMRNVYTQFSAFNTNGTLSFDVGFAKKILRQTPSTPAGTSAVSPTSSSGVSGAAVSGAETVAQSAGGLVTVILVSMASMLLL